MREVVLCESDVHSPEQLHAYLCRALYFPAYYGENFAALSDCLGDICCPTRVVIYRDGSIEAPWFDKACAIIGRAALENHALDVVVKQA